jgi:hypothetical protein
MAPVIKWLSENVSEGIRGNHGKEFLVMTLNSGNLNSQARHVKIKETGVPNFGFIVYICSFIFVVP